MEVHLMMYESVLDILKTRYRGYWWIGGIILGTCLLRVPVLGVGIWFFSLLMFLFSLRCDTNKALRMYNKGMQHFNQHHYTYAYVLFKKAYGIDNENPKIIEMLVESNLNIGKDPLEARMLIDELAVKWKDSIGNDKILKMRERLSMLFAS